jgi:peptidoglycan-associated lipoprotein
MTISRRVFLAGAGFVGLTACAGANNELGYTLAEGDFTNATENNTLVHNGELDYRLTLARRFANEVTSTVNFPFDSAYLDADSQSVLQRQAHWMRQFPEVRFKIYGHTDAPGSAGYNYALGQRRANAVLRFLTHSGVPRSSLEAVVSRGQTQPLIVTEGREPRNRRTVTEASGFVRRHPTVMNGQYAEVIYREYLESARS